MIVDETIKNECINVHKILHDSSHVIKFISLPNHLFIFVHVNFLTGQIYLIIGAVSRTEANKDNRDV